MSIESLTLADLRSRPADDLRLLVLGDPIEHSLSPVMQNAGLEYLKLPFRYGRLRVAAEDLLAAFDLLREKDFLGWNVTLPHKLETFRLMDGLDPLAKRLGSVNTVVHQTGKLFGFNTDGRGLVAAIEQSFGSPIREYRIALLGAGGGAGQAAARYLAALQVSSLHLINRTVSKLDSLAEELGGLSKIRIGSWDQLPTIFCEVDLIINAASGGHENEGFQAGLSSINSRHRVFDMSYRPGETALVRLARERRAEAVDGLSMLFHQGKLAFEIWFGKPAPAAVMQKALYSAAGRSM
jgi:shikimate dehydrogenase